MHLLSFRSFINEPEITDQCTSNIDSDTEYLSNEGDCPKAPINTTNVGYHNEENDDINDVLPTSHM